MITRTRIQTALNRCNNYLRDRGLPEWEIHNACIVYTGTTNPVSPRLPSHEQLFAWVDGAETAHWATRTTGEKT